MRGMIGFRIKEARVHRGMSQQDLAEGLRIRQSAVSAWELGKKDPTMDNLSAAAALLRVSLEWLGTGEGEMEPSQEYLEAKAAETGPLEARMLGIFRELSWTNQQALIDFLEKWK